MDISDKPAYYTCLLLIQKYTTKGIFCFIKPYKLTGMTPFNFCHVL